MELLKKITHTTLILFIPLLFTTCGEESIEIVINIRVDTFISSASKSNNSELDYLTLSKSSSKEERILLKLPTSEEDFEEESLIEKCSKNAVCSVFFVFMPVLVTLLTQCTDAIMTPANLDWAELRLNTADGSSIAAGDITLNLLNKPWYHTANWNFAHPFSSKGKWDTPGGDIDSSTTFLTNCTTLDNSHSCAAGEIRFNVLDYFRSLITNEGSVEHFGLLLSSTNAILSSYNIHSSQKGSSLGPRIVASYSGSCTNGLPPKEKVKTFYLGSSINKNEAK